MYCKEVRGLSVHLRVYTLLLNFEVLPKFQVLDSILPCCSGVTKYNLHLYILVRKEESKAI